VVAEKLSVELVFSSPLGTRCRALNEPAGSVQSVLNSKQRGEEAEKSDGFKRG